MIADLDETIRQLLIDEIPIKNGEIDISFDQPKREWSARLTRPSLNFFLFDLRENANLRQHQWEQVLKNNSGNNLAHLKRTPYRVDCAYVITAWATEAEDEHRLLTRCLLALFRHSVLPEDRLIGNLKHQPYEVQTFLGQYDRLSNPAELWSAMDNEMRPSIPYVVTISLDPWTEISGPIVKTFTLKPGQTRELPRYTRMTPEDRDEEMVFIGGTVWKKKEGGDPLVGSEVAIKGTGLFATTDEQGRFILGSMLPGDYTLVAWLPDNKTMEKKIVVPADDGNYDLIV